MTTDKKILLGYEIGTGAPVEAKLHHLFISGLTQHSGKTTGLEAFIKRAQLPALIFRTGRGELGFPEAHRVLPYFRERTDWRFLEGLLSAHLREKTKIYRSNLMEVSRGATTLQDVWDRIKRKLTGKRKARGWDLKMFTELDQYFSEFMPTLGQVKFAPKVELVDGLNLVDLEGQPVALQQMVIAATLEYVMEKMNGVIVVVPEAYKLIPIDRPSPIRLAAETITREGMKINNFLWLDSQQLTGLDLDVLRNVDIWLFGRQTLDREKERAAGMIPGHKVSKDDMHGLTLGQFYVVQYGEQVQKIYVQPAWLPPEIAQSTAKGGQPVASREFFEPPKHLPPAPTGKTYPIHLGTLTPDPTATLENSRHLDGPPENAIQRLARENASGALSGLDPMTRMANLIVDQQRRIDELSADFSKWKNIVHSITGNLDGQREDDISQRKQIDALQKQIDNIRDQQIPALVLGSAQNKAATTIEVTDPSRVIVASETLEPLKVDTFSLRGQIAKLIEEGAFTSGATFGVKSLQEKLAGQFGSAGEWNQDQITQEIKELSAPPYRLFLSMNNAYRIRKRKN